MINRKLNRNRIVYVIPPPCMKFLKRKSTLSSYPSTNPIFDPNAKCVDPSKIEVSESKWPWPRRTTAESSSETKQPTLATVTTPFYQATPTAISSQVRTTTAPFAQLTTQFSSKTTNTTPIPNSDPASVQSMPAIPTKTTPKKRVSTIYEPLRTDKPIFTSSTSTKASTLYPTITESADESKSSPGSRLSSSPTERKYTPTSSTAGTSSSSTTGTASTSNVESSSTIKGTPTTITTPKTSNKCLEWYNKIKEGDQSDTGGNCSKWYNLIKQEDKQSSMKSSCSKIGSSSETKCPPNRNRLALNGTDKYSDIRTGIEYLQPIFSSSAGAAAASEVLDNPFMEFLITRPRSNKKGADVFNLTIDDRIRTLKWLNQQILQRYGMLAKIDRITRANRSFANASNSKTKSRKVSVNNSHKTTRAQRLRDEFIRKKMQRMSLDKNDGWWKNFNAKSYRRNSTGFNFFNSNIQEVE